MSGLPSIRARQSRLMSLVEAKSNAVLGLLVSWVFTYFCLPWFGLEPSPLDATGITASYFVLSLGRSYVLRRFFNRFCRHRFLGQRHLAFIVGKRRLARELRHRWRHLGLLSFDGARHRFRLEIINRLLFRN